MFYTASMSLTVLSSITCINVLARALSSKARINLEEKSITRNIRKVELNEVEQSEPMVFSHSFSVPRLYSLFSLRVPSISIRTLYTSCAHNFLHFNCITFLLRCRKRQTEGWRMKICPSKYYFLLFPSFSFVVSRFSHI